MTMTMNKAPETTPTYPESVNRDGDLSTLPAVKIEDI